MLPGTPPSAALDQFLRDSYEVVQAVHRDLDAIRAVASHLTPVEDLVEFQAEVTALHAKLGLLVAASELIVQASEPGIALLLAETVPAQRALLELGSAALRPEDYFATASNHTALRNDVIALTGVVDGITAQLPGLVTEAELATALTNALTPIQAQIDALDARITADNETINETIDGLTSTTSAVLGRVTSLETNVASLDGTLTGHSGALNTLQSAVTAQGEDIAASAADIVALNTAVANAELGLEATNSAVQSLTSRTEIVEGLASSHSEALTQLSADVTDTETQVAAHGTAISALTTTVNQTANGLAILSTDASQLESRVTDTETNQAALSTAMNALTTSVEQTEDSLVIVGEDITQLKAQVTSVGNLLTNAGFEVDTHGWTLFSRGAGWLSTNLGRDLELARLPVGTHALSLTPPSGVPAGNAGVRSANLPVEALKTYIVSGHLAGENCTSKLEWRVLNAAGVEIGFGVVGQVTDVAPATNLKDWQRKSTVVPVPSDGAQLQLQWWVTAPHVGTPKAWLLRPMVEEAIGLQTAPSPWVLGMAGVEEILATATQALTVRVEDTEDTLLAQATSLTELQSSLSDIGGDNLLYNSNFVDAVTAAPNARPKYWQQNIGGTGTGSITGYTLIANPLASGTQTFRIDATLDAATRYIEVGQMTGEASLTAAYKVRPGKKYTLGLNARGTPGRTFAMYVQFLDSAGVTITAGNPGLSFSSAAVNDTFQRFVGTTTVAPVNAAYARIYPGRLYGSATVPATYLEVNCVQLQEGAVGTAYQPAGALGATLTASAISALDTRVTAAEGVNTSQATSLTNLTAALAQGKILPSTFEQGAMMWTAARAGDPTTVATFNNTHSAITNDADFGRCLEITGWTVAGQNILTKGVVPALPGKKYRITAVLKLTAGDNSSGFNFVCDGMNGAYTEIGAVFSTAVTVTGPNLVTTLSAVFTDTAGAGVTAWATNSKWLRFGLRLNNTETSLTLRVQSILVEDITVDQAQSDATTALTARVTTAEGSITSMASAQTALAARVDTAETALVNEMITSANQHNAMVATTNQLTADLDVVEAGVTAHGGAITTLQTKMTAVEGTVSSHSTSLTNLQAQVDAMDLDTGGFGSAISALDTRVDATEDSIASHSSAITALQSSVTNANKIFVQAAPPATAGRSDGDLWFDTDDGNKCYSLTGGAWVARQDLNKNTVFIQPNQPTAYATNDLWIETDASNKLWRWNGTTWVDASDGRMAAHATAITNLETRATSIEGVNTSQGTAITALQNTVNNPTTGVAALASAQTTLTSRVDSVEATNSGQAASISSHTSQITALESTVNNPTTGMSATSTAVTNLSTRTTAAENNITTQAASITSLNASVAGKASASAVQSLEVNARGSGNLITNSQFSTDTAGWIQLWNQNSLTITGYGRDHAGDAWRPTGVHTFGWNLAGNPTGLVLWGNVSFIPVTAGKKYIASAYCAAHRCNAGVGIAFFDAAGAAISEVNNIGARQAGGTDLNTWDRVHAPGTAPSNARYARIYLWQSANGGGADPYAWFCKPQLEEVPVTTEYPSPWSPGGAEASARWGIELNVDGYISGVSSSNNGVSSDFTVLADKFQIIAPGVAKKQLFSVDATGVKLASDIYASGNGRIVMDTGAYMKVMGIGFGTFNQFVEWYGPKMALNLCSEANAIYYLKTNGQAYFGGSLSAGVLKNSVVSSQIGVAAVVETGAFGTNGNPKNITGSLSYNNGGYHSTNLGNATLTATLVVDRSLNGGAWVQVGTINITGSRTMLEFESGLGYLHQIDIAGSVSFVDNTGGTPSFNYRTRMTAGSGWPQFLNGNGSNGTQRTTILSTEQ